MPTKHALLSPSSLHRWSMCPASVVLSKDLPDEPSPYAEEGTMAHAYAEAILNGTEPPQVTKEMAAYVNSYVEFIEGVLAQGEVKFAQAEVQVSLEDITGEAGAVGTVDFLALVGDTLWVCDLKYGQGIAVKAEENPQLSLYACAALDMMSLFFDEPVKKVMLAIVQPRLDSISTWEFPLDLIPHFRGQVREVADHVRELLDGKQMEHDDFCAQEDVCRFCKAKVGCPAQRRALMQAVNTDFEEIHPDRPLAIPADPERLSKIYTLAPMIRAYLDEVEKALRARAINGEKIPGLKLVLGKKGNRKWSDPAAVEDLLTRQFRFTREEAFDFKLKSPTQLEKLAKRDPKTLGPVRWDRLKEYIIRPAPTPILVPEDDKRAAIECSDFDMIEQEG